MKIFFFWGGGGGGTTRLVYIKGSFLCILWYFLRARYQNGENFRGVAKILNIFCGP